MGCLGDAEVPLGRPIHVARGTSLTSVPKLKSGCRGGKGSLMAVVVAVRIGFPEDVIAAKWFARQQHGQPPMTTPMALGLSRPSRETCTFFSLAVFEKKKKGIALDIALYEGSPASAEASSLRELMLSFA